MKTLAVICEYNPFTEGHKFQLAKAKRETGADTVVCVMSGSFTQRGDAAVFDKYRRAAIAVKNGADLVVELPLVYSISSADNFAYGAIKTVSALPYAEYISFGSECGDIRKLRSLASFLKNEPAEYKTLLYKRLKTGVSFPKAQASALAEYAETHSEFAFFSREIDKPNNALAVSYIKATDELLPHLKLHTVKREDNYNSTDSSAASISSSAVRHALRGGRLDDIKSQIPAETYEELSKTKAPSDALGDILLYRLSGLSSEELGKYYDVGEGLNNRIKSVAANASSYEELLERVKTKRYTMARLKRIALYVVLGITEDYYKQCASLPPYLSVLAIKKERRELLSALRTTCEHVIFDADDLDRLPPNVKKSVLTDRNAHELLNIVNKPDSIIKKPIIV